MSDWRIHRKLDHCGPCGRELAVGEAFFSLLRFDEEGLGREDRCTSCFEELSQSDPDGDRVFWRTRRQESKKKGLAVDFEAVERLFLALEGREEDRLRELRYLLSLLLMRKRRLKLVRVKRAKEAQVMILRRPRRTEELAVDVFDLSPEKAEELRGELERIFEGAGAEDLATPPAAAAEGEDPAPEAPEEPGGADSPAAGTSEEEVPDGAAEGLASS